MYISYPWRRLLRELLQTKPSDDDSFFCGFVLLFSVCVVWLMREEFFEPSKKTPPPKKKREKFIIEFTLTYTLTLCAFVLRIESIELIY